VADIVGGSYFGTLVDALARCGRYAISGAIAGPVVQLELRTLLLLARSHLYWIDSDCPACLS